MHQGSSRSRRWLAATATALVLVWPVAAGAEGAADRTQPATPTTEPTETTEGTTPTSEPSTTGTGSAPTATTGATETTASEGSAPATTAGETATTLSLDSTDTEATIVVGAVLEPSNLDILHQAGAAIDQVLLDNVYETLLRAPDGSTVEPGLAELPEVSDDGTTYTFTLQEGVTFHDGSPLTAADVVWSLDEARSDTGTAADDFASVESVTAVDDQTVEVVLTQPDNELQYNLTRRAGAVVKADATDLESSANGTGPFAFVEWNTGSSITLERSDDYWGDPATVAEVTFQYFTDPNAAVNAFTTGDVDILTGINSDLIGPLQDNPDYVVNEGVTNGEFTLGFNNERAPLDNRDVRQAIRQAIDKQGILELYNGFGTIIGGPVPPQDPWYEDLTDTAPYDLEAARSLLEGAGVAEGTQLTLSYPNIYPTNVAEYIASQLAEIGIEVTIETIEFPVWLEQVYANADYDMTVVLHVEPHDLPNYANPEYYWRYDSPEVQQLIADARTSTDPEAAVDLLREAARQVAEDSPTDWLLLYADLTVSTPNVTGYPVDDTASRFDASNIRVAQ